ncbi:SnoaL-like domain-containing protein [Roseococcus sp.]|uniref:SnoaL-like domain-containing protein n=1 Tax=Roseococcus sp. TaxID=2109646 RepID=UPI003BA8AF46
MIDIRPTAETFTALLKQGDFHGAAERFWHEDVSSIEAMGEPRAVHGKAAVAAKGAAWYAAHEVKAFEVEGPYVNEDQFALTMRIDVTVKASGQRVQMTEVGLYTVDEDGMIVEERFFY